MSEIQQSRYDQILRRVADLKGPGSKVNDALTELFPMIDVENVPGELLLLGGTLIAWGSTNVPAVVAESSRAQVFNPVASGKLLTVTSFMASAGATTTFRWAITATALLAGVGTEVNRDARRPVTSQPTGQIRSDTTLALTDANGQVVQTANRPLIITDLNSIGVCPPGFGFEVGLVGQNTPLQVTFYWRERVAEPSELNF